jgi:triosephosphate isomerase (TIM)
VTVPARIPIIGGNWKMNTTLPEAVDLARQVLDTIGRFPACEVVLYPPFPNLVAVHEVLAGSNVMLGAQDLFWEDQGAFTGEVSGSMLTAVGCTWALVGHSERRRGLGESDEMVNRKLHAALRNGLKVTLAVGETREERAADATQRILETQLRGSLTGIEGRLMERIVIAYEPVWAIGTGDTASPDQCQDAHSCVRTVIASLYGDNVAQGVRIQYGGSVTAHTAPALLSQPGIDGALVGGASLNPDAFAAIVRAALA